MSDERDDAEPLGLDPDAAIERHRDSRPGFAGDAGPEPAAADSWPESTADAEPEIELDPDVAILEAEERHGPPRLPPPVIDTRKYQFIIGGVGLTLVLAFSVYLFIHGGGKNTPGISAGQRMPRFVAPLAVSSLPSVDANAHPVCNPARPSPRGLNVCNRGPLVLDFFALQEKACVRQVSTLQSVSRQFPQVTFAAVAINASKAATARDVRRYHWTIPVAYDLSDTIGEVYGVEVCPITEIVKAGGTVEARLIGEHWEAPARLARAVARLRS